MEQARLHCGGEFEQMKGEMRKTSHSLTRQNSIDSIHELAEVSTDKGYFA